MKSIKSMLLVLMAVLILYAVIAPNSAVAEEILANNSATASCINTADTCYTTIQGAIDAAYNLNTTQTTTIYSVRVESGNYAESITLKGDITVQGRETARTILSGSGTLVTANTGSAPTISNFTFANASIGIDASNNAHLTITNNIFIGDIIAVKVQDSASTGIVNNVFYANGTAISRNVDNTITNNIFMSNSTTAIVSTTATYITYNDFNANASDGVVWSSNSGNISSDPLFVNVASSDFHLLFDSPCKGKGSGSTDMGAYGGTGTDTIPFQVSGVTASLDTTTNIISVSWNANNSYLVTGYRVYYGTTSGVYSGTGATEGSSPIFIPNATTTSTTLSGLSATATTPANPTLNPVTVLDKSLGLSWDAVSGATGYRVYYDVDDGTSLAPTTTIDVGNETSYTLTGLTNNVKYKIAVSAIAQPSVYVAVTAMDTSTIGISTPGIDLESAYSVEVPVSFGAALESGLSNVIIDYPEALVAYPNLTNQGPRCFIATAAFGYYSAPEVQALREFRDRYLLTNSAGSAFVRWYYEHGPVAAAYLDAHPEYKPVVRAALMPAVGAALFMTKTPFFLKTVITLFILMIAIMTMYRFSRKKLSGSGGSL